MKEILKSEIELQKLCFNEALISDTDSQDKALYYRFLYNCSIGFANWIHIQYFEKQNKTVKNFI